MRQRVFAHACTCSREKLEQASSAEEIKIVRVEARSEVDVFTTLTSADPAIFDARQPLTIDLHSALSIGAPAQNSCMKYGERHEQK